MDSVDHVFPANQRLFHLREAEYVALALPHTSETEDMLGEYEFRAMKGSAYLVNVRRGSVIDERAMIQALEAKWIAGEYLDALAEEPLPQNHALWDMENVFLVPHDSHSSPFIGDRLADPFCDNLRWYVMRGPLRHLSDPEGGY